MSEIAFRFLEDANQRKAIADHILHGLPEWFGIEDAIVDFCAASEKLPMVVIVDDEKPIGFCSLKVNYGVNCELYVLGILPQYHHQRLGQRMMAFIEEYCRKQDIRYLSVKTLSESHPDEFYGRTRRFYEKCGFIAFAEFPELWGLENPCLLMIKPLEQ
jgi:ribosomal protein S18 acetylase RimI-like enzyme